MKKTITIIAVIIVAAYVIISAIKGIWNPFQWFASAPTPPADGTPCKLADNTTGEIKNGVCAIKIDINPNPNLINRITGNWVWYGNRRMKCFAITPGSTCAARIYDSVLGWGMYYAPTSTATKCCYIF